MQTNRREFLYTIMGGTAAISGWILASGFAHPFLSHHHSEDEFRPQVADGFVFRRIPGGGEIIKIETQGSKQVVCEVNESGFTVLENLNGKNTLQDVARIIHGERARKYLGHTEASVASFLAMLAQAGVLSEPFFVNLETVEITV